jgi:hypothetical protein
MSLRLILAPDGSTTPSDGSDCVDNGANTETHHHISDQDRCKILLHPVTRLDQVSPVEFESSKAFRLIRQSKDSSS